MKILLHTPEFPPCDGGVSAAAYEYARAFQRLGHAVTVVTPSHRDSSPTWDAAQLFEIQRVRSFKSLDATYFYQRFHLHRLLSRLPSDVLLSQRWKVSGLVCETARRRFAIPHLQWFHGNEVYDRHLRKRRWMRRFVNAVTNANWNISVSRYTERKMLERVGRPVRSRVIYHGVDSERFIPSPHSEELKARLGFAGRYVLLTLARLVPRKGQDEVIRTLPYVSLKIPNVLYVIAGKGRAEQELRALAAALGVQGLVHFSGFVPEQDKVSYYQMCDLYLMPSREIIDQGALEGFGLTFLEANACGKPVIAGNSGGCVEAVQEGVNGLIVDPTDTHALVEAILRFHDPLYYTQIARSALALARQQYRWESSARAVLGCLPAPLGGIPESKASAGSSDSAMMT